MAHKTECTCCTCGFTWTRGEDGSHSCVDKLESKIAVLETTINELVTEYCDREGAEDMPVSAIEQSCPVIGRAMLIIDA